MRLRGNSLHTEPIYDSNNRFVRMNLFSFEAIACFVLLFSIGCLALFLKVIKYCFFDYIQRN